MTLVGPCQHLIATRPLPCKPVSQTAFLFDNACVILFACYRQLERIEWTLTGKRDTRRFLSVRIPGGPQLNSGTR